MASTFTSIVSDWDSGDTAPAPFTFYGGPAYLFLQGTLGGGSVKLQILGPDGTNYVDVTSSITSVGATSLTLPAGKMKLVATGGSISGLYAQLRYV